MLILTNGDTKCIMTLLWKINFDVKKVPERFKFYRNDSINYKVVTDKYVK